MALFQYMTGNHDWEIAKLHNIRLVKSLTNPLEKIIPIPYDFDYSGMVNTHYALPPEALGIESVRTRFYRGYCLSTTEEYQEYFQKFLDVKEEMYALVQNFELLDSRHSDEMIDYLDSYYTIIENPRLAKMNIIDFCKQIPSR